MNPSPRSTLILVTTTRIARMDFGGGPPVCKAAARMAGVSATEAVRMALALGGKTALVWVLSEDVFEHRVMLNAAQVAGLSGEQLGRALSFEVEPFSGIPVAEGITGFHRGSDGAFDVIELARTDLEIIHRAVKAGGGKLAGIAYSGIAPGADSLEAWLAGWLPRLQGGALPLIRVPPPAPSKNRFLVAAIALEAVVLLFIFACSAWTALQRGDLEARYAELTAASSELDSANKSAVALKKDLAALETQREQRERVTARRGSLPALLNGLAATHGEDMVIRGIQAEGPSSLVVNGVSLDAEAVDELSIVLTQKLRKAGWTAQPRNKTGLRKLPSGGPWEFSLVVTHEEGTATKAFQLSQRRTK